eukprot:2608954-Rhodomonas_salina.2
MTGHVTHVLVTSRTGASHSGTSMRSTQYNKEPCPTFNRPLTPYPQPTLDTIPYPTSNKTTRYPQP